MRKSLNNTKIALLVSTLVIGVCWNMASRAELAILEGADLLEVSSFHLLGQDVHLRPASSGSMDAPAVTIGRLNEVPAVPEAVIVPEPEPRFALGFAYDQRIPTTPYGNLIRATSQRHDVNPQLVVAMVRHESGFDAAAESPRGARGLMQLMPATAERFGVEHAELGNPASNLEAGVRYIAWLSKRFDGDLSHVLAAFNSGEGTVDRYDGVPPYRETREYIKRIYAELGLQDDAY